MHRGYIKIFRKISEWEWYKDSNTLHLFFHLLLNANYKDGRFMGHEIKRGQIVTGRKALSIQTGLSEQSVRTSIERLKSTSELTTKSTNKFSIITLCNYNKYQNDETGTNQQSNQQSNQHLTSNQPAINQQLTTSKECKNDKNDKNNLSWRDDFSLYLLNAKENFNKYANSKEFIDAQQKYYPNINIQLSLKKYIYL